MDALDKTLAVLEALGDRNGGAQLGEVAARTQLPKPTVHRILQRFVDRRYAVREGDGRYAPGPRILSMAGEILASLDHARYLAPILRELHADVGHTVHFAVLSGREAVYVEKLVDAAQPYRTASRIGMRIPLHCTAIGKAILSLVAPEEVGRILDGEPLVARTPHTITSLDALFDELTTVRARGFSIDDEENERNVRCVGAAVRDNRGRPMGALSHSRLAFELSVEEAHALGSRLVAAADALSAALGAPDLSHG